LTAECLRCGRPMAEQAYADQHCADQAAAQLAEIADMVQAARDIATGQASHSGGSGSGKPGSRLPLDLAATAKLDAVQNELTTWARHVAEERGAHFVSAGFTGHRVADPLAEACSWLGGQLEWLRHRQEIESFLTDVEAAQRIMRGLVRGPAEQKYLGPCGAWRDHGSICGCEGSVGCDVPETCDGDVYGRVGAKHGACRTCGAQAEQAERRAWLDDEVRSRAFRAVEIAGAYQINVNTIRSWAARGHLLEHGRDRDDRPLYNVGDVLDLAAADAARRETNRADRARRAAAKAAESEEAA
jgi:hypothetical protein